MITQKMKYALKALMELAAERVGEGQPLRIEEIAKRSGTPKRFLEHILLEVRNAGYVASVRGRHGGYVLIKNPREVPLSELMRLIDSYASVAMFFDRGGLASQRQNDLAGL